MTYTERTNCIFCKNEVLETLLESDSSTSISLGCLPGNERDDHVGSKIMIPYNIQHCKECNSCQTKYIGDLQIVYETNHLDNYGTTKTKKFEQFSKFILENPCPDMNTLEIGACHTDMAEKILQETTGTYTIIEPAITTHIHNPRLNIINDFFENVDIEHEPFDAIIMSDVFEHFYNPVEIIRKIQQSGIKYIYMNHPDFDYSITNNINVSLNIEHTFLIEHQFLFSLFENHGFRLSKLKNFESQSLFLEFTRIPEDVSYNNLLLNINTLKNVKNHIYHLREQSRIANEYMSNNPDKKYYIWPCSVHSATFFSFGFDYTKLTGICDNSPNKIGKYLNGYGLECVSFDSMVKGGDNNDEACIFISSAGSYTKELALTNPAVELRFL